MDQYIQFGIGGIVLGSAYAIAASGLVLTYTTTGVFNFAHGAVGGLCAYLHWWLVVQLGLPVLVSFPIVALIAAPLLGAGLERSVFRRFRDASVEATLVVTIALTLLLIGVTNQLFDPQVSRALPPLLGDNNIEVLGVRVTFDEILTLALGIGVAVFLRRFLFGSRLGTAMRAVVDDPDLAALSGARATTIAQASWALGFVLASLAGILLASDRTLQTIVLAFLVLNAYAAALVGKLKSLPMTFAGAIILGLMVELSNVDAYQSLMELIPGTDSTFPNRFRLAIPAILLFGAMLAMPQSRLSAGRIAGRRYPRVPSLPASLAGAAVFVAVIAMVQMVLPDIRVVDLNRGLVYAVVILSLLVATGLGGQIQLATFVFMAVGAAAMGRTFGGTSPLGLLAAFAIAAPVGVLATLPALRLKGLYLALSSFAFALAARDLLVSDPRMLGNFPQAVGRADFGVVAFTGDGAYSVFLAIVFSLMGVAILAARRSKWGRLVTAMRDSEAACATLGASIRLPKLVLAAIYAGMAGVGGALLGGFTTVVSDANFEPIYNLQILLFAFVGGVTSVTGAFIGGMLFTALTVLQIEQPALGGLVFAVIGAAAIGLGRQPNGLAGMLFSRIERLRAAAAEPVAEPAPLAAEAAS